MTHRQTTSSKLDREDFALTSTLWSERQFFVGVAISAVALACFAYLLLSKPEHLKDIQTVAVTLVVLAAIPWLGLFVHEFQVDKGGIRATLVKQQRTINVLKLITVALLTDFELEILGNLVNETGSEFKLTPSDFFYNDNKRTIIRLIGLGFLKLAVPGEGFGFIEANNKTVNLLAKPSDKPFLLPTTRGKNFYKLYERVHGPVDLDKLDKLTLGRLC